MDVKEMYLCDGERVGSKYLLTVHEDGLLRLKWCCGNVSEAQVNPIMVKVRNKMMLEYGEPNLFQIRRRLPFTDENGKLEPKWTKIK